MWQFIFLAFIFVTVAAFLKLNQKSRRHAEFDVSSRLTTGSDFRFPIVGESSYQAALRHALGNEDGPLPVLLVPEDSNPHDHLAVRVMYRETTIGYLSRLDARALRGAITRMGFNFSSVSCLGKPFGGTPDKPTIGIWLNISIPQD
ncbi:hypothetical protein PAN31117_03134 [Pandoraea anapnoica]|uniref:HIRAN domain-containing protein n=1 Tax=Pandoraea anapnoica TaxID=2508301 RepID=A0A5E5A5G6_9BURK|nr:hypothetical protein [Pandoraea anapnoica]VVE68901.1 hypothetical protein PAN31117_03134 [Pandoraea anapnoica]